MTSANPGRYGETNDDEAVYAPTHNAQPGVRKPRVPPFDSRKPPPDSNQFSGTISVPSLKEPPSYSMNNGSVENIDSRGPALKEPPAYSLKNPPPYSVKNGTNDSRNPQMFTTTPTPQGVVSKGVPGKENGKVLNPKGSGDIKARGPGARRETAPDFEASVKMGAARRETAPDLGSSRNGGLTEKATACYQSHALRMAGPSADTSVELSQSTPTTESDKPGAIRMGDHTPSVGTFEQTIVEIDNNPTPVAAVLAPTEDDLEEHIQQQVEQRLRTEFVAVEVDKEDTIFGFPRKKFILTITAFCLVAVALAVSLGLTVGQNGPTEAPTPAPTIAVSPQFAWLRDRIGKNVTDDLVRVFNDPTTSQYAAMDWLANNDTYRPESVFSGTTLDRIYIERYVLALLYFSMEGESWEKELTYLKDVPVCEWKTPDRAGVNCTDDVFVTSLNFGGLGLDGPIASEIGLLESLDTLILDGGDIKGQLPETLYDLTNLIHISIHDCSMTGSISPDIRKLTNLIFLDLYDNNLSGTIPTEIGLLTKLIIFNLWDDDFIEGTIPTEIGLLTNLGFIDFGGNSLTGSIPPELGLLTQLTRLSLERNTLTGSVPSEMGLLTNLKVLSLRLNSFSGSLPLNMDALQAIDTVYLERNNFTGSVNEIFCGSSRQQRAAQLWADCFGNPPRLQCSCCTKCCPEGEVCDFVPEVVIVPTPSPTIYTSPRFNELVAQIGTIVTDDPSIFSNPDSFQFKAMDWLADDAYRPENEIPDDQSSWDQIYIQRYVLAFIYFSMNGVEWRKDFNFLTDISECDWKSLDEKGVRCTDRTVTELDFALAGLDGSIPGREIGLLKSLEKLALDGGDITGSIPKEVYELTQLTYLSVHDCSLTVGLSSAIGKLSNLVNLDLYDNNMKGFLPTEIGLLTRLTSINMWDNDFMTGTIPTELGFLTQLTFLDLGSNILSGSIPSSLGQLIRLTNLSLETNILRGNLPTELGSLTGLEILDLRGNKLTGSVPSELGALQVLNQMKLDGNSFTGSIDYIFCGRATAISQLWADCEGDTAELQCSCCKCCPEGLDCQFVADNTPEQSFVAGNSTG